MAEKKPARGKTDTTGKPNAPRVCCCPYCETEVEEKEMSPLCKPCGVTLQRCPSCLVVLEPDARVCPKCGKAVK